MLNKQSARKLIATDFWNKKEVLIVEFMQQGTTITSEVNWETLTKLRSDIQNKRRGMLTYGVVLLQNNARPHTATSTRALLEHFNCELFDHPSYSPDPSPSDSHLFTHLKNWLWSQRFNNNEELMEGAKQFTP
jgi:hypothetical protein